MNVNPDVQLAHEAEPNLSPVIRLNTGHTVGFLQEAGLISSKSTADDVTRISEAAQRVDNRSFSLVPTLAEDQKTITSYEMTLSQQQSDFLFSMAFTGEREEVAPMVQALIHNAYQQYRNDISLVNTNLDLLFYALGSKPDKALLKLANVDTFLKASIESFKNLEYVVDVLTELRQESELDRGFRPDVWRKYFESKIVESFKDVLAATTAVSERVKAAISPESESNAQTLNDPEVLATLAQVPGGEKMTQRHLESIPPLLTELNERVTTLATKLQV